MNTESGNLFTENGVKMTLSDLLNKIPDNNWKWSLFDFEGVGVAPHGMGMPEFEELVASERYGFYFNWDELKLFGKTISDVKSCVLVAVKKPVEYDLLMEENDDVIAYIGIFDSTNWELKLY